MAAEEVHLGHLVFEEEDEANGSFTVTARRLGDLEGWVTFILCPEDEMEWSEIRNRCFPFNGREGSAPVGQWVVCEFVGKESCSLNLFDDRSAMGFTNYEIVTLTAIVNMAYHGVTRIRADDILVKHSTH